MRRLLAFVVVLGISGILAPSEGRAAESQCGQRVLADWFENGRVDRVYPIACYEEAIAAMPADIRDYTDARDVIGRALTSALRGQADTQAADEQASMTPAGNAIDTSGGRSLPLPMPLVVLFGLALAVLGAGVLARLGRRLRER
ncbi:MAG: hypothetical protein M3364_08345 [Actinomycetota bacterium]|nr:hypothetical protein [Actinomycetota bacterium]